MSVTNFRYLQQPDKGRIEHDLVLTRIGELGYDNINKFFRAFISKLSANPSAGAAIFEGLMTVPGAGLSVDMSFPASFAQKINDQFLIMYDTNDQNASVNIPLNTADPTNPRIDCIFARVNSRDGFQDQAFDVVDPTNEIINPETEYRDKVLYADYILATGTPAPSPTPASAPATVQYATLLGTVSFASPQDLSVNYLLYFAVGDGNSFVSVDCRGATPSATTGAEVVNAINAAGFGTIASLVTNFIQIQQTAEIGWNSYFVFKAPASPNNDGLQAILGLLPLPGYKYEYRGNNPYFKVAEITVVASATSLFPSQILDRTETASWGANPNSIVNYLTYEDHRLSNPMDHEAASVFLYHLAPEVTNTLNSKITQYRGQGNYLVIDPTSTDFKRQKLYAADVSTVNATTSAFNSLADIEQQYPVSRVDQSQTILSSNYNVPASLSEAPADTFTFNPTVGLLFGNLHNRVGVYVKNKGTGYTALRIVLHDQFNNLLATGDIAYANVNDNSLAGLWNYVDLVATIDQSQPYHYHVYMVGFVSGSSPVLGMNGSGVIGFREMYKPVGGKYGSANWADVIKFLDLFGNNVIPVRGSTDDNITTPGTGYIGETSFDVMAADLSNNTVWANTAYNNYIVSDLLTGRLKLPTSLVRDNLSAEFNTKVAMKDMTDRTIIVDGTTQNLHNALQFNNALNTLQAIRRF